MYNDKEKEKKTKENCPGRVYIQTTLLQAQLYEECSVVGQRKQAKKN
jgi:hypothetical protein